MSDKKHLIWAGALVLIIGIICGTVIYLNNNPYAIRLEMDDNTKEAIESLEFPILDYGNNPNCFFDERTCNYICCVGSVCSTTLMSTDWCKNFNYSKFNCNGLIDEGCSQW